MKPLSILGSALFTLASAQCLGLLAVQWLRPRVSRQEQYLYAFAAGSGMLSLLVFLIAAAHLVWTGTFVIVGVASIGACISRRAYRPFEERLQPLSWSYRAILIVTLPAFAALYFAHALAPEANGRWNIFGAE